MEPIKFEWDENKNQINKKKHDVLFDEAKTVFYDENALCIDDPDHSEEEERFIILGTSVKANLLVVCHCIRFGEVIRIISARKATKSEMKQYYEFMWGDRYERRIRFFQCKKKSLCKKNKAANNHQPWQQCNRILQKTVKRMRYSLSDADKSLSFRLRGK